METGGWELRGGELGEKNIYEKRNKSLIQNFLMAGQVDILINRCGCAETGEQELGDGEFSKNILLWVEHVANKGGVGVGRQVSRGLMMRAGKRKVRKRGQLRF